LIPGQQPDHRQWPGQVVALDNLLVHKSATALAAIEVVRCPVLFLPTYSPDFNPIEHAFAKARQRVRRLQARSQQTAVAAVGEPGRRSRPVTAPGSSGPQATGRDRHDFRPQF
jgi:transposase